MEALASGEIALKLSSAIASARKVFREKELQENAELQVSYPFRLFLAYLAYPPQPIETLPPNLDHS